MKKASNSKIAVLLLAAALLFPLLPLPASADPAFSDESATAEPFISEDTDYVRLSEPADGQGRPVELRLLLSEEPPEPPEYRWYACDAEGGGASLLSVSREGTFLTEPFDSPEIRYYLCEVISREETFTSGVFSVGFTGLPALRIVTENEYEVDTKEVAVNGTMTVLDGVSADTADITIKCRGNASLGYPKKPYTVKLEKKNSLLGMAKAKKWALLPGYCDKTLLRAGLGFEASRLLGLAWTPSYRYVDLVLNGVYLGNYLLTETVKETVKAVGIGKDGWILEETSYDDEAVSLRTAQKDLLFHIKYPDDDNLSEKTLSFLESELNQLEQTVLDTKKNTEAYQETIDTDSWINWLLLQNVLANQDTNKYYYKTHEASKVFMGPAWDFEWSLGIGWYEGPRPNPEHKFLRQTEWFRKLLKNRPFQQALLRRWNEVYPGLSDRLLRFMDDTASAIRVSADLNFRRWDILSEQTGNGGVPLGSWEAEIACDKTYLQEHIEWLNREIPEMCGQSGE